jgi:hypothetical protein
MRNSHPQALGLEAFLQDRPHIKAEPIGKHHARVAFRGDGCGQRVRIHTRGGHELLKSPRRAIEPGFVERPDDLRDQAIFSALL